MNVARWSLVLLGLLFAVPASADADSDADSYMRMYFAGGTASSSAASRGVVEFGVHSGRLEGQVAKGWALSMSAFETSGDVNLPLLNAEAFGQYRVWSDGSVSVAFAGGVGVSVLLIVPFPALHISAAIELPIADGFAVDMGFHTRALFDPYTQSEGAVSSTVQLGVSF